MRCFEMLSARDLEFSTFEANKHQHTQMKTETAKSGLSECALKITIQMYSCFNLCPTGMQRVAVSPLQRDLTFDLFVCAAVLMSHRDGLFRCEEMHDVYELISRFDSQ